MQPTALRRGYVGFSEQANVLVIESSFARIGGDSAKPLGDTCGQLNDDSEAEYSNMMKQITRPAAIALGLALLLLSACENLAINHED